LNNARLVTTDLDPTNDLTHGAQQLTFFNAHYDSYRYLPNGVWLTFTGDVINQRWENVMIVWHGREKAWDTEPCLQG
jgi:hypothetical protein